MKTVTAAAAKPHTTIEQLAQELERVWEQSQSGPAQKRKPGRPRKDLLLMRVQLSRPLTEWLERRADLLDISPENLVGMIVGEYVADHRGAGATAPAD